MISEKILMTVYFALYVEFCIMRISSKAKASTAESFQKNLWILTQPKFTLKYKFRLM